MLGDPGNVIQTDCFDRSTNLTEEHTPEKGVSINAQPPFDFGIGLQGELIISWVAGGLPDGTSLRMHLSVPAEELPVLRRGLDESKSIQKVLAAKPPTQSTH